MGYKVKRIMIWQNGEEKQVRPVWKPNANTIAYYPFENDTLDATGNTTISSGLVKDGLGYRPTSNVEGTFTGTTNWISFWVYIKTYPTGSTQTGLYTNNHTMVYYPYHNMSQYNQKIGAFTSSSYAFSGISYSQPTQEWHWIGIGYTGSKTVCTIDGVSYDVGNVAGYNFGQTFGIEKGDIIVGDYIIENTCWTADEITLYYNQTKSKYGL